jgi:D-beta-D-heptose 7-phosphate kinase/D-beta-D-heptose 1-phosphate adenosyltransferase
MLVVGERSIEQIPTLAREVFDVTGAGDTVVAALAVALACEVDFYAACELANAAAGLVVGKRGAAQVSLDEIQASVTIQRRAAQKLTTRESMQGICSNLRASGRRIVFTNGCFDVLHVGHAELLAEARSLGDVLIVGLNTDSSTRRLKPGRPINVEGDRAHLLGALESVDYVVLFDEDTPYELVASLQPDVIVKGGDYTDEEIVGADLVLARGGAVHIVPLVEGYSTTSLAEAARSDD